MLCTRLIFLLGAVFLVDAKSTAVAVPAEDDWEMDEVDMVFENFYEEALRVRRNVNDEKETTDRESNSAEDPALPRGGPGSSGECMCPPPPPGGGLNPCQGLSRTACLEKMAPPPYNGPPCELRMLFGMPTDFNHTARKECFEKWEKPALEKKGVDFSKPFSKNMMRLHFPRSLMILKGCKSQCMFMESKMVVEKDSDLVISKEAVMDALKEDDDPQELIDVFEETINKCVDEASELVHPKQTCKSGSDEFLSCVRFGISNACPGAKWKENRSCTEVEDANTKLRNCRRQQRSIFMERFRNGMKNFRSF